MGQHGRLTAILIHKLMIDVRHLNASYLTETGAHQLRKIPFDFVTMLQHDVTFIEPDQSYLTIIPAQESTKGYFQHVALVSITVRHVMLPEHEIFLHIHSNSVLLSAVSVPYGTYMYILHFCLIQNKKLTSYVTQGEFEVTDVVGFHRDSQTV